MGPIKVTQRIGLGLCANTQGTDSYLCYAWVIIYMKCHVSILRAALMQSLSIAPHVSHTKTVITFVSIMSTNNCMTIQTGQAKVYK